MDIILPILKLSEKYVFDNLHSSLTLQNRCHYGPDSTEPAARLKTTLPYCDQTLSPQDPCVTLTIMSWNKIIKTLHQNWTFYLSIMLKIRFKCYKTLYGSLENSEWFFYGIQCWGVVTKLTYKINVIVISYSYLLNCSYLFKFINGVTFEFFSHTHTHTYLIDLFYKMH